MKKIQSESENPQVLYDGRWVSRENFRVFVYQGENQKLVNSYDEFKELIEGGLWFANKEGVEPRNPVNIQAARKRKNGSNS